MNTTPPTTNEASGETPETDAENSYADQYTEHAEVVPTLFARQLELQRNAANARADAAEQELRGLRETYERAMKATADVMDRMRSEHAEVVAELEYRLEWARTNCRVVYCPPDGAYPIEHAPHAKKDAWHSLAVAADTSRAIAASAPTKEDGT